VRRRQEMGRRAWVVSTTAVAIVCAITVGVVIGQSDPASIATATLVDAEGAAVGTVTWTSVDHGVNVEVSVAGLPPGFHGFHVHAVGECVPPFSSAGSHLNPHGTHHPAHAGDMPVLLVNADGRGEARFLTDRYAVADLLGAALIIHANPDNYANIPERYLAPGPTASPANSAPPVLVSGPDAATLATGDAGARIACGVIGTAAEA
jgi:Cu-Zn family superoxide dismutase